MRFSSVAYRPLVLKEGVSVELVDTIAFLHTAVLTVLTQLQIAAFQVRSHHLGPEVSSGYCELHCSMPDALLSTNCWE